MRGKEDQFTILHHSVNADLMTAELALDENIVFAGISDRFLICRFHLVTGVDDIDAAAAGAVYAFYDDRISDLFCGGIRLLKGCDADISRRSDVAFSESFFHLKLVARLIRRDLADTGQPHLVVDITDRRDSDIRP